MPTPLTPEATLKGIREDLAAKLTYDQIVAKRKTSIGTIAKVKREMQQLRPETKEELSRSDEVSGDNWNISLPNTSIKTLEELVEHCKIDLQVWEVERFVCNKWEVAAKLGDDKEHQRLVSKPLFQVKAWLKRRRAVADAKAAIEALRIEAQNYSPKFMGLRPARKNEGETAAELFNTDHHLGSLIWGEETGGPDWDNGIAMEAWKDSFCTLIHRVEGYKADMAVIPLGSDQENSDNGSGTTTNQTPQSMDSRYQKVFNLSKAASKFAIDTAYEKYGRVHVPIVPGNHNRLSAWHLGDYLQAWYRNHPGVTIDNRPTQRKWWEFGVVMLMWEHGDKGKVPDYGKIMASEQPEMWGRTKWREAHVGHLHTRRVFEDKGYTARICPSLRPSCAWSVTEHHTGSIRASESFVWSKTEGLVGTATFSILG
jgi:hypothetical protein